MIVKAGFLGLDNIIGGFKAGELVVVGGRPGMGKTSFSLDIARHVALEENKKVCIFSYENSTEQVKDRLHSTQTFVPLARYINNIFIEDCPNLSVSEIRAKLSELVQVDLVIIDYVQLIPAANAQLLNAQQSRVEHVTEISRTIKSIAKELHVPILLCSQLPRSVEKRENCRPQLNDLFENGSLGQDADVVLLLYRSSYYDYLTVNDLSECIIAKHRGGDLGTVSLI